MMSQTILSPLPMRKHHLQSLQSTVDAYLSQTTLSFVLLSTNLSLQFHLHNKHEALIQTGH
jgi:hypothetical protein